MAGPGPAVQAEAQLSGNGAVAAKAKSAHVGEAAHAAAFHHGDEGIGIPETAAAAPVFFKRAVGAVIELALVPPQRFGIQAAERADAVAAGEDLGAEVAGVGAQPPLVDAGIGAEGEAAAGDFGAAPAAGAALALHPSAGGDTASAHTRSS